MDELKQKFIGFFGQKHYDLILAQTNETEQEEDGTFTGWDTTGWTILNSREELLRFNLTTIIELSIY